MAGAFLIHADGIVICGVSRRAIDYLWMLKNFYKDTLKANENFIMNG